MRSAMLQINEYDDDDDLCTPYVEIFMFAQQLTA